MQHFPLGSVPVSRIGYGAMQLAGPGVFGPPRDHDQAIAVLRRAVELGVDHIDTSQYYGPDVVNELIREALHMMQRSAPDQRFDDQLEAMVKAREDGLIAGIGLSEVSLEQLLHAAQHTEIVCVQNQFNLVDRSSQPVLDECTARGIAFVPFFPLGSGFAADNPVLGNEQLRAVAAELDRTPAQVALAWTLSVAPNVLLIPGTSSVSHLEENLAAGDIELSAEAQQRISGP